MLRCALDVGVIYQSLFSYCMIVDCLHPPQVLTFGSRAFNPSKLAGFDIFPFKVSHGCQHG